MKFEESDKAKILQAEKCIIYFLIDGNEVVYVGQSKHGLQRPFSHTDKDFTQVAYMTCEEKMLDYMETKYIRKYNPKYNKSMGNFDYSMYRIRKFIRENTSFKDITVTDIKRIVKLHNLNTYKNGNLVYVSDKDFGFIVNFIRNTFSKEDNLCTWRLKVFNWLNLVNSAG